MFALVWLIRGTLAADEEVQYSLSGYIKDAANGEVLLFANLVIVELNTGATTNQYGFYSLKVPAGNYTIQCSYLGYETVAVNLNLKSNANRDIELKPKATTLKTVEIIGKSMKNTVRSLEMGTIKLDIKQLKSIPVLFGERDILKAIQLLPGVSPIAVNLRKFDLLNNRLIDSW